MVSKSKLRLRLAVLTLLLSSLAVHAIISPPQAPGVLSGTGTIAVLNSKGDGYLCNTDGQYNWCNVKYADNTDRFEHWTEYGWPKGAKVNHVYVPNVMNGTLPGPNCAGTHFYDPTLSTNSAYYPGQAIYSEQCEYMTIMWPAQTPAEPRDTIMFIVGGAYVSGPPPLYNMSTLAQTSNSVVASPNYPVTVFGWTDFAIVEDDGTVTNIANIALNAQRLALKWKTKYIDLFTGNGHRRATTLMGQSAGGSSVVGQVIVSNPDGVSEPLEFSKIHVLSGFRIFETSKVGDVPRGMRTTVAVDLSIKLGCNTDPPTYNNLLTRAQFTCLQSVPTTDQIVARILSLADVGPFAVPYDQYRVAIDGLTIKDHPSKLLQLNDGRGPLSAWLNHGDNEGAGFIGGDQTGGITSSAHARRAMGNMTQYASDAAYAALTSCEGDRDSTALPPDPNCFPSVWPGPVDVGTPANLFNANLRMRGYLEIVSQTVAAAKLLLVRPHTKVYLSIWTAPTKRTTGTHAKDICTWLRNALYYNKSYGPQIAYERALTDYLSIYTNNFYATSNPNGDHVLPFVSEFNRTSVQQFNGHASSIFQIGLSTVAPDDFGYFPGGCDYRQSIYAANTQPSPSLALWPCIQAAPLDVVLEQHALQHFVETSLYVV